MAFLSATGLDSNVCIRPRLSMYANNTPEISVKG